MSHDRRHARACARGEMTYLDPDTGYRVFTALALRKRGECCGCACRHCPYGHEQVPDAERKSLRHDPWLELHSRLSDECDVLSWSGGKDSYLALLRLAEENRREVVLLTTFDGRSGQVAHQDVHIDDVRDQARSLSINLLLTPLYPDTDYRERVELALHSLHAQSRVRRLAFGDLHLESVRCWREEHLGTLLATLGAEAHFPLWGMPYRELESSFFASGASATISAIAHAEVSSMTAVGCPFTAQWLDQLPADVDRFGENGEFHTLVKPPSRSWRRLAKNTS